MKGRNQTKTDHDHVHVNDHAYVGAHEILSKMMKF